MIEARSASDVASLLIRRNDVPVVSTLNKIRTMISSHRNPQESDDEFALHRIFVCFNTLISYVKQQYILTVLMDGADQSQQQSSINTRGDLSVDINARLSETPALAPEAADSLMQSGYRYQSPAQQGEKAFDLNDDLEAVSSSPKSNAEITPSASVEARRVTFVAGKPKGQQIMDLLHLLVELKESSGVERAILSSLLAFRGAGDPSLKLLVSDLILQVENQRSLISQLETLPDESPTDLVLELASLSPMLEELQMIILSDFASLKDAQYGVENIWDLITVYIDKLHSVELFLIEELEYLTPVKMNKVLSSASLSALVASQPVLEAVSAQEDACDDEISIALWLRQVFSGDGDSVTATIQSLSAKIIKERILEALHTVEAQGNHDTIEKSHQYSAAINLNQEMNRVLNTNVRTSAPAATRVNEWEISIYELKFTKRIGVGAAATTYLADWTGQEVAVKVWLYPNDNKTNSPPPSHFLRY
jgi:hypothetical protein